MSKPSISIITCYKQPDYVRAVTLRQGLRDTDLFSDVIVIKNSHTNILRYLEVLWQLARTRVRKHPDAYLLTFRGYELLPFVRLITAGKPLIYDEFINPVEWFVYEHKKFSPGSVPAKLMRSIFRWYGKRTALILTDTQAHAEYSADLMNLPIEKYGVIPVGTDEQTFRPQATKSHDDFRVLYYGNMLPLHGIDYVLEAAVLLAGRSDITFHLVGGKQATHDAVTKAQVAGAHIEYDAWVPYEQLPELFAKSDVCLGGPFGATVQSQFVITGKTYQFMAAARPVIVGVNKETGIFTDKKNSLLVPEADAQSLREAITWAADHPQELQRIGEAGRVLYEQQFSAKRIAGDLRLLFESNRIFDVKR